MILLSGKAKMRTEREFAVANDRLSTFLPKVGAFKRRGMGAKELSCKGLNLRLAMLKRPCDTIIMENLIPKLTNECSCGCDIRM